MTGNYQKKNTLEKGYGVRQIFLTSNGHSFYLKIGQNLLNFILEALIPTTLKTASLKKPIIPPFLVEIHRMNTHWKKVIP